MSRGPWQAAVQHPKLANDAVQAQHMWAVQATNNPAQCIICTQAHVHRPRTSGSPGHSLRAGACERALNALPRTTSSRPARQARPAIPARSWPPQPGWGPDTDTGDAPVVGIRDRAASHTRTVPKKFVSISSSMACISA